MKNKSGGFLCAMVVLLMANAAFAQRKVATPAVARPDDIAVSRAQAEAGNIQAQLSLANHLAINHRPLDALAWYQKAAAKLQVEAYYHLGNIFLFGATASEAGQSVAADPVAGVKWTFRAATNLHAQACLNMSRALERGLGVRTNLIEACAWMHLFAEREPISGRSELTNLTGRLDPISIQEGQKLAVQLKARQWANLSIIRVAQMASSLRLEGVTIGGRPLAVINRRTLTKGESVEIPVKGGTLEVKCLEIEEHAVLVQVSGEPETRLLRFGDNLSAQVGR